MEGHNGRIQLSRADLYEHVWTTPMCRLAREFGLSDVGLSKLCHRHEIPTPPRGYWVQKDHGKAGLRPPLPRATTAAAEPVIIEASPQTEVAPAPSVLEVAVSATLVDPHPLVARTARALRHGKRGDDGRVSPRLETALPVTVGRESIDRAARILDAVFKAVEARGHQLVMKQLERSRQIVAHVAGEEIPVQFGEGVDRGPREPTLGEQRQHEQYPSLYHGPYYQYVPSGRLFLRIDHWCRGLRKHWGDGKKQRLENCLGRFITQLEAVAVTIKKQREEREEAARRRRAWEEERAEKLRLIHEEEERVKDLHAEVDAWHRSERVRRFIDTVRAAAIAKHGAIGVGSELERWLTWAAAQADRIDPLVESPHSILDERRKYEFFSYPTNVEDGDA